MHYSPMGWLLLVYLGLVPTAVAYGLFYAGLRLVEATVASVVVLLEPLVSIILSLIIFGNEMGAAGLIGGMLLLGAQLLLSQRTSRHTAGNAVEEKIL
ncbi:hypothetical protein KSC_108840 [Ktedonobacter sp. SOSP1-52]|uniref:EamA family transporter n=1 Tax=Ktedonobacter sp. SOSP1-52 TaxID=2778366 RepID=UPI001916BD4C|nr:EamA family transporter [Ktedonobacter sp. SOSP1-52]GHO71992.1 hypothetical protein KSC_108840 [Ktedonobacter sp. SOSP1-52]